ncbi:XRE family transcriptional regulator [bacterium 1XD42-1]|nr:XRE family transcriptional regulator [bacterium 1XD42-8]RKJ60717.1 XRE family transcriptional regulator [bacterium 1XD42-1]
MILETKYALINTERRNKIVTFGDKLKICRAKKNMTQDEFARLLGTTKQVISRYETNQRVPKITTVSEYAKILEIPLEFLLDNDADHPTAPMQRLSVIGDGNLGQNIINTGVTDKGEFHSPNPQIEELIRIYQSISIRKQVELLRFAYELEEKQEK